jgi:hypothetical protein
MPKSSNNVNYLSKEQSEELINKLKSRFEKNMSRHKNLNWADIQKRLDPKKIVFS